jgi:hypothetical protein
VLAAQRLAAGAASTSLRALNQRPAGSGPTAAISGGGTGPDGDGSRRRRRSGTAADSLRIGSSGRSAGVGVNLGG